MYLYLPIKQRYTRPELGSYESYAVAAFALGHSGAQQLAIVHDVTTDSRAAALLARRCTDGQLEPAQLWDVVEDFII